MSGEVRDREIEVFEGARVRAVLGKAEALS